jgi:hypothetical protein
MATTRQRRLYTGRDLQDLLQLAEAQIDQLVNTGQLKSIKICGEVRFDAHDIDTLILTYNAVSQTKNEGRPHA